MSLNVSFKLSFFVEECWTHIANIFTAWSDLSLNCYPMRPQVMIKLRHSVKLFRTLTANVLLDLVVRFHVIIKVGNLGKGSTTVHFDADERSLACVKTAMIVEIGDLSERFAAVDAKIMTDYLYSVLQCNKFSPFLPNIWTIICVNSLVISKVRLLRKSFLAITTNVFLICRMVSDVIQQRSFSIEDFLAERALSFLSK